MVCFTFAKITLATMWGLDTAGMSKNRRVIVGSNPRKRCFWPWWWGEGVKFRIYFGKKKKAKNFYMYLMWVSHEIPDVQAGFRKGTGTRDPIANIHWIIKKAREFQENIYFCFIDYAKTFNCVDHKKLWKIRKEMGIPDHLTCLLRNLYAG